MITADRVVVGIEAEPAPPKSLELQAGERISELLRQRLRETRELLEESIAKRAFS